MVSNWFPYFLPTSLFFGSKRSKLLFSYLLSTITCFALSRKTNWFGEIRETDSLPWELQRRCDNALNCYIILKGVLLPNT